MKRSSMAVRSKQTGKEMTWLKLFLRMQSSSLALHLALGLIRVLCFKKKTLDNVAYYGYSDILCFSYKAGLERIAIG